MTAEQQAAHLRMLTYLPRKTHLKIMADDKQEAVRQEEAKHNLKLRKPILANGKVYSSVTECMKGERIAACTLYERLKAGLYRYISPEASDGIPTFSDITTSAPSKAALRRRERGAR